MAPIVFENQDIIIADKPHGLPTVPLKGRCIAGTLLGLVATECPEVLVVEGHNPWEGGTLHRLDTATSGLVVFARNQEMYDHLSAVQKEDLFKKTYRAKTIKDDRLKGLDLNLKEKVKIVSYFRSYGKGSKEVRPIQDIKRADAPVLYETMAVKDGDCFTCTITIHSGIRSEPIWHGSVIRSKAIRSTVRARPETLLNLTASRSNFPCLADSSSPLQRTEQMLKYMV